MNSFFGQSPTYLSISCGAKCIIIMSRKIMKMHTILEKYTKQICFVFEFRIKKIPENH